VNTPINEAHLSGPVIDCDTAAALMEPLTELVIRAGAAILAIDRLAMKVEGKTDGSPVTEADLAADRIIGEGLARLIPAIPAISEERVDLARSPYRGSFFLIDPLDGTKEYVAGRDEFTVNLALVSNGTPLLGIIGVPALGLIWRGLVGQGAQRLTTSGSAAAVVEPIHTRRLPPDGSPWIAAVSRSHGGRPRHRHRGRRQGHGRKRRRVAVRCRSQRLYRSGVHCLGRPCRSRASVMTFVRSVIPLYLFAVDPIPPGFAGAPASARSPCAAHPQCPPQRHPGFARG
jgi:3'(2'), 5'-bisphosphate nucleotidase